MPPCPCVFDPSRRATVRTCHHTAGCPQHRAVRSRGCQAGGKPQSLQSGVTAERLRPQQRWMCCWGSSVSPARRLARRAARLWRTHRHRGFTTADSCCACASRDSTGEDLRKPHVNEVRRPATEARPCSQPNMNREPKRPFVTTLVAVAPGAFETRVNEKVPSIAPEPKTPGVGAV